MFIKILIANRGEIAVRIIRTCRELGIRTVAVYSSADEGAMHVRLADQAVLVGDAPPADSYLNASRIISAAHQTRAEAIHPGYGFLSENADFAKAVNDSGLTFIGPGPQAIKLMGDKAAARRLMMANNVPVIPGYHGTSDDDSLAQAADRLGYPLIVKPTAGGGGKAMHLVESSTELKDTIQASRREAGYAFGSTDLILEKFIENAHHIEFQIIADTFGNIIHLCERECSIQRRHQKILEETPSPVLGPDLREEMGRTAIAAARSVGYVNAGTVEFLLDPDTNKFYFLEMNTRLQVEHPVTELTLGLDMVEWQIRIAAKEPIPFRQADIQPRGHAIEARIYAEDPSSDFLPTSGKLLLVRPPLSPGVRVDSGVETGDGVTSYYDPLLAKVIVHSDARENAIRKLALALEEFVIFGVKTNLDFLGAVLSHDDFRAGVATSRFIENRFSNWQPDHAVGTPALILASLALLEREREASPVAERADPDDPFNPWAIRDSFRIGSG